MSASLASVATALETAAGASTSANPNEPGYWTRIAAAAEVIAGDTTAANANQMGSMLRAAVALESIAGTSGTEENTNESGYMKRIVDALEVQAGAVTVGSSMGRMVIAAQNASFESEPTNIAPDPGFDVTSGGWSGPNWTISGGVASANTALSRTLTHPASPELVTGHTYRCSLVVLTHSAGGVRFNIGGTLGTTWNTLGAQTQDIVAGSTQSPRIIAQGASTFSIDDLEIIDLDA